MSSKQLTVLFVISVIVSVTILSTILAAAAKPTDDSFLRQVAKLNGMKYNPNYVSVEGVGSTNLKIDPSLIKSSIPKNITISLFVTDVTNLTAADMRISFPTSMLDFHTAQFTGTVSDSRNPFVLDNTSNESTGEYRFAFSYLGEENIFTGSGALVKIIFNVTGSGTGTFHLHDTILAVYDNKAIVSRPHSTTDGSISTWPRYDADANGDGVINSTDSSIVSSLIGSVFATCPGNETLCHADVDNDFDIDATDLDIVTANIGQVIPVDPDVDGDSDVDLDDLIDTFLNQFADTCPWSLGAYRAHKDWDQDCDVDIDDLIGVFLSQFQLYPP